MKEGSPIYNEATELLKKAQSFSKETLIGVDRAIWKPKLEYPNLPFALGLFTDIHFGSLHTDYDMLNKHLKTIEDVPNFGMITNGDNVDNFIAAGKAATGTYENPLPPQLQTLAFMDKLKQLNKMDKLGLLSYGNHENFGSISGYDWLETWARQLPKKIPIFTSGGLLTLQVGKEKYEIGVSHHYWGASRLNPTNSNKRFLEYEHPNADVAFLGHCFDQETEILTPDGWKRGLDIKEGEMVGTMNMQTEELQYNKVNKKFIYDNFTELTRFWGRGYDISVTDQHAMVYAPTAGGHKKNAYQIYKKNKKWNKTSATDLYNRRGAVYLPLSTKNKNKDISLSDDEIRLIGWLVSEGHFRKNGAVQLFQNVGKKADIIRKILKNLGIEFSEYLRKCSGRKFIDPHSGKEYETKKNIISFYITVKNSRKILELIRDKKIPKIIMGCSTRQFGILLEALCLGDGCRAGDNSWLYYTIQKDLADQIQELCVKNGYRSSIGFRKNCYELVICNRGVAQKDRRSKQAIIPYMGLVWCLSVDNGTLVVRSNGRTIITGNTHTSEMNTFERGGKERIAVIGGTYKKDDSYAKQKGISTHSGKPGLTIVFYPNERKMIGFKHQEDAAQFMLALIYREEKGKKTKK